MTPNLYKSIPYISNQILIEHEYDYAAIIGIKPSAGARSPALWNSAYEKLESNVRMLAFDVASEADLDQLIQYLRQDPYFRGGAVTAPYKSTISPMLDGLDEEAETIGAVNCIYRDDKRLVGANTDGEAALEALETTCGTLEDKCVALIGIGGAGLAVATYLAKRAGKLLIANRTHDAAVKLERKLSGTTAFQLSEISKYGPNIDILVNATSCGFEQAGGKTPQITALSTSKDATTNLEETALTLKTMKSLSHVFDIVYQPEETPLLECARKLGLKTSNGLEMNFLQAVIAFTRTNKEVINTEVVKDAMRSGIA